VRRYIPGDLEAEILEAHRQHIPLDQISARTGFDAEHLRAIVGLPASKTEPAGDECDLWAFDASKAVL
jgi:hypothetical protein